MRSPGEGADLDHQLGAGGIEAREHQLRVVRHRGRPARGIVDVGIDLRLGLLHRWRPVYCVRFPADRDQIEGRIETLAREREVLGGDRGGLGIGAGALTPQAPVVERLARRARHQPPQAQRVQPEQPVELRVLARHERPVALRAQ